jgi:hypothetical protein
VGSNHTTSGLEADALPLSYARKAMNAYRSRFLWPDRRDRRRGLSADGPYHVGVKPIDLGVNRPLRDASTIPAQ